MIKGEPRVRAEWMLLPSPSTPSPASSSSLSAPTASDRRTETAHHINYETVPAAVALGLPSHDNAAMGRRGDSRRLVLASRNARHPKSASNQSSNATALALTTP
jgi:hypothetical protein